MKEYQIKLIYQILVFVPCVQLTVLETDQPEAESVGKIQTEAVLEPYMYVFFIVLSLFSLV